MSPSIAIIASGIYSPLCSAIEFAKKAQSIGYEIRVFAPTKAAGLLSFAGLEHHTIPNPKIDTRSPLLPATKQKHVSSAEKNKRLNAAISALGVDTLKDELNVINPDLIFIDCEMHAHIIVALSVGKPVIQYSSMYLSPPSIQAPPLHKRSFPGQGILGSKIGVAFLWAQHLFGKASKIRRNQRRDQGADHPAALIELAHRLNVPIRSLRRFACWQMPWSYRIPTALFLPRALDLPTKTYEDMTYLGPTIMAERVTRDFDEHRIAEFCDASGVQKRIYVGFGSMMSPDARLVPKLWDIASRHPEWRFLCAAGKHWNAMARQNVPRNVEILEWVPQQEVLEHSDLFIFHGGTSSLVEAVEAGTPMLVFPHVNDQKGSAARVVFHGLGRARRTKDSTKQIEADIVALLDNPNIAKNCEKTQQACRVERDSFDLGSYLSALFIKET